MVDGEPGQDANKMLIRALRSALRHLYDPVELGRSPLIELCGVGRDANPPSALRRVLTSAIESLRPDAGVPPDSVAWRIYLVLSLRYAEQFTQRQVAHNLSLSKRHVERLESQGLQLLAATLQARYDLACKLAALPEEAPAGAVEDAQQGDGMPSRDEELEWLKTRCPSEPVDAGEVVRAAISVLQPLIETLRVTVECAVPPGLAPALAQATALRQAIVNILTYLIRWTNRGRVRVVAEEREGQVVLYFHALPDRAGTAGPIGGYQEVLETARQLIGLSRGTLRIEGEPATGEAAAITVALPASHQVPVLAVDDNADALRMLQRYFIGSRYRFIGTSDPELAVSLCDQHAPRIIILDVMLPGLDGWELLGRLREHPKTSHVPVVICTILPQEELALDLGAAACLRKPVSRAALLEVLDRQLGRSARGSQSTIGRTPADPEP